MNLTAIIPTAFLGSFLCAWTQLSAQDVLPFPEPASASVTGKTLKDSKHQWRKPERHLPADAPNIVIFMTDDGGFANASTFGGPVHGDVPQIVKTRWSGLGVFSSF